LREPVKRGGWRRDGGDYDNTAHWEGGKRKNRLNNVIGIVGSEQQHQKKEREKGTKRGTD